MSLCHRPIIALHQSEQRLENLWSLGDLARLQYTPLDSFANGTDTNKDVLNTMADQDNFSILTPNAMLGYGYRQDHFWYGVEKYKPAAIIVDSGSTDGGPYKLGMNKMTCGRESYERDLSSILEACFFLKIKVLIGSVGGDGSNSHVDEMLSIVEGIAEAKGFSFKIATIKTDISRDLIRQRIVNGKSSPCGPLNPLKLEDIDKAVEIVGQMGAEP